MYRVLLQRKAERGLRQLPRLIQEKFITVLLALQDNPRPPGCKKLRAGLGWRLRIGEYRLLYDVDDNAKTVTVWYIGPRGDAYR